MRNNKLFVIATALSIIFVVLLGIIVFSTVQVVEDVTFDMAAPSPNEASVSTGLIGKEPSSDPSVLSGTSEAGDTGISPAAAAEEKSDSSSKEAGKTDSDASSVADPKADADASPKKDTDTDADASSKKDTKADADASSKKNAETDADASSKKDAKSDSDASSEKDDKTDSKASSGKKDKTDSDASSGKDDKTDSKSSSGKKGKTDSDASSGKDKETASAGEATADALSDQAAYAAAQLLRSKNDPAFWAGCPDRNVQLLTVNPYSRCGDALTTVTTLVIHYVGNAGTSAMDNREYFEDLKDTHITSASSHFIISLDGEIVQCIPLSEVAYASNDRNNDTIAIECCHPEADGKFSDATYASLVELSAFLCKSFHINPQELLRHYDVSGKLCPLYFVEHPDEWQELKDRIEARTDELLAEEEDINIRAA